MQCRIGNVARSNRHEFQERVFFDFGFRFVHCHVTAADCDHAITKIKGEIEVLFDRDGRIEQVGSPIELYERPANAFVAQFIGSPKMNFFKTADLTTNAATVLGKEIPAGQQVGLRPEHLVPADGAKAVVEGKMDLVENLGEYALVHLITATGVEFIAKTEKAPEAEKGPTIGFTIKPELAHYFDIESGLRQ